MMPEAIARGALIAASLRFAAISAPTSSHEITERMLH
jgi:hypothetical protein